MAKKLIEIFQCNWCDKEFPPDELTPVTITLAGEPRVPDACPECLAMVRKGYDSCDPGPGPSRTPRLKAGEPSHKVEPFDWTPPSN